MKTSDKKYIVFSEIKQNVSITNVLGHYGLSGKFKKNEPGVFMGFCPIHRGIKKREFKVEPYKNRWYCIKCKEGGDIISLVSKIEQVSIREAGLLLMNALCK